MRYIQHHFSERTNIDPAPITMKDSESSENISSGEDNVSESEEDILITGKAISTDSSFTYDNDGYDEVNGHTTEKCFTVTRSGTTAAT